MIFYDVGANIGFFTLIAARLVGATGRVLAFDPVPSNIAALQHNLFPNGYGHVLPRQLALADRVGQATLALAGESVLAHLSDYSSEHETWSTLDVRVSTVDVEVAQGSPTPDVVKIDVEGAELAVLEGARQTIIDARPVIICELHGTGQQVVDFFANLGADYELRAVESGGSPENAFQVLARPTR
jgi:FkbM family methyltransferase